jgi:hypothetical protein
VQREETVVNGSFAQGPRKRVGKELDALRIALASRKVQSVGTVRVLFFLLRDRLRVLNRLDTGRTQSRRRSLPPTQRHSDPGNNSWLRLFQFLNAWSELLLLLLLPMMMMPDPMADLPSRPRSVLPGDNRTSHSPTLQGPDYPGQRHSSTPRNKPLLVGGWTGPIHDPSLSQLHRCGTRLHESIDRSVGPRRDASNVTGCASRPQFSTAPGEASEALCLVFPAGPWFQRVT